MPENLRLGQAIESFRKPERVVVGFRDAIDQPKLTAIFAPFCSRLEWMSLESAEMTKHALNAFLATSITFINELARLCEALGADAKEVERGLKSDGRIGSRAYLAPGGPIAGGTLVRDVRFLTEFGQRHRVGAPLLDGVLVSNEAHKDWMHRRTEALLGGSAEPVVAVLGLTYKPGTSTLRRSHAVEFCAWLRARGARVQAHDPAVVALPEELCSLLTLCRTPREALTGADLAVIATEWPDFRKLTAEEFVEVMRRPQVIDQTWFLAPVLAADRRITYVATGRPDTRPATGAATT